MTSQERNTSSKIEIRENDSLPNNIHIIGIGGDGMSALAGLMIGFGKTVSGSEQEDLSRVKQMGLIEEFVKNGCVVNFGHKAENLPEMTQMVVRSSIIPSNNPEVAEAIKRGLPVIKRSEALGRLMIGSIGLSIGGCAGKSTSCAMAGYILAEVGEDPNVFMGARTTHFSDRNFRVGKGEFFVAEADEFDRSFLDLRQETTLITNIFFGDHMDYYKTPREMYEAFIEFVSHSRKCFVRGDDPIALENVAKSGVEYQTFGFSPDCDWSGSIVSQNSQGTNFELIHKKHKFAGYLRTVGRHNVANALGVVAMLASYDIEPSKSLGILGKFEGINRRLEKRGLIDGVVIYDDYGHNKKQIDAALEGLRQVYPENDIYCVFQPRQFRRTKELIGEIAQSFNGCKAIGVLDISRGIGDTEKEVGSVSSRDVVKALCDQGKQAVYTPNFEDAANWLRSVVKSGDVVITFGTGDPYRCTDLLKQLGRK